MRYCFQICVALSLSLSSCTKGGQDSATAANDAAGPAAAPVEGPRLVILGFDGVDPGRVDRLIGEGRLPHLKALGAKGYRGPLATANPPQSPVAWSAFATGMSAGKHGIFDFIGRNIRSYFPKVATSKVRHAEINNGQVTPGSVENLRRGPSFWDVIARTGVPVRTLSVPYAYPPPGDGATSLGGLGTPDVRGTNSVFTLLTTDGARAKGRPPAGGQVAFLEPMGEGAWRASIKGPSIKVDGANTQTQTSVIVRSKEGGVEIEMGGERQSLKLGETGKYVTVSFVPSSALTIQGVARATVLSLDGGPEIYLEPLSIHPEQPYLPVSSPPALAQNLWKKHGPFKTVGWIHDTSALGGGVMDEDRFLVEAMETMKRREKMTLDALEAGTDRILISVFTAPDRIGHTFYRYMDPEHAAPRDGDAARYAKAMDVSYDEMDRIVGEVVGKLRPEDVLLIMSDHGFGSFRRGFHINRWLVNQKFMTLKKGVTTPKDFFLDVDWSKTRAYAMGTGSIFINIKGRERSGIVEPGQARKVAEQIATRLKNVKDRGKKVVAGVYFGDDLYQGPERREAPDVRVALVDGYRASWATTLGGIPKGMFEDNLKKWSGDHASADPEAVPGILVSNVKVSGKPRIEDLAATAYGFAGVAPPSGLVGKPLLPAGK